jgi:ASC-1-like (ASCH) protein
MTHNIKVDEPWFSLIKVGYKTVEGRLNKGNFAKMSIGDTICFENHEFGFMRQCMVKITNITHYTCFKDYLETETLKKCLPTITTLDAGLKVYYKYYSIADEQLFGVIALELLLYFVKRIINLGCNWLVFKWYWAFIFII